MVRSLQNGYPQQAVDRKAAAGCSSPNGAGIDPDGAPEIAVQLFHPRNQVWSEHFEWKGAVLSGLSPTGRATISVLRINDSDAIEFRQLLLETGYEF